MKAVTDSPTVPPFHDGEVDIRATFFSGGLDFTLVNRAL